MLITVLILVFSLVAFLGTNFTSKVQGSKWLFSEFVSEIELSITFLLVHARSQATHQMKDLIKIFHLAGCLRTSVDEQKSYGRFNFTNKFTKEPF